MTLDILGWYKTTGDDFILRAYITFNAGDGGKYDLQPNGPWDPRGGDVITDVNGLTDTVASGLVSDSFKGLTNHATWSTGLATVTRRISNIPSQIAHFSGMVGATDDPLKQETVLTVDSDFIIAHTLSADVSSFFPTGWPYASVIEITPSSSGFEIRSAHWNSPQQVKELFNAGSESYIIKNLLAGEIEEEKIRCAGGADLTVLPGETIMVVRDTQGSNDRWRAARIITPIAQILFWAEGTFVNTSERRIWDYGAGVFHGPFSAGTPAVADIGGALCYQTEPTAKNYFEDSEDFTGWDSPGGGVEVVVGDAAIAPDGTMTADEFTFAMSNTGGRKQDMSDVPDNVDVTISVWAKLVSGLSEFRLEILKKDTIISSPEQAFDATSEWQRFDFTTNIGAGATTPDARIMMSATAAAEGVILFWGAQLEENIYASSYIKTGASDVTRQTDDMEFPGAGSLSIVFTQGEWLCEITPSRSSANIEAAEVQYIYYIDSLHFLSIEEDSGNVLIKLSTDGGVLSRIITYSSHQVMTVILDFINDNFTVDGATTGSGTSSGAVSNWFVGGTQLHIGSDSSLANNFSGRICEPIGISQPEF